LSYLMREIISSSCRCRENPANMPPTSIISNNNSSKMAFLTTTKKAFGANNSASATANTSVTKIASKSCPLISRIAATSNDVAKSTQPTTLYADGNKKFDFIYLHFKSNVKQTLHSDKQTLQNSCNCSTI